MAVQRNAGHSASFRDPRVTPRATRVYDRFSHDPEKRTALEAWERRLLRVLAEKPAAGNVRSFERHAS